MGKATTKVERDVVFEMFQNFLEKEAPRLESGIQRSFHQPPIASVIAETAADAYSSITEIEDEEDEVQYERARANTYENPVPLGQQIPATRSAREEDFNRGFIPISEIQATMQMTSLVGEFFSNARSGFKKEKFEALVAARTVYEQPRPAAQPESYYLVPQSYYEKLRLAQPNAYSTPLAVRSSAEADPRYEYAASPAEPRQAWPSYYEGQTALAAVGEDSKYSNVRDDSILDDRLPNSSLKPSMPPRVLKPQDKTKGGRGSDANNSNA